MLAKTLHFDIINLYLCLWPIFSLKYMSKSEYQHSETQVFERFQDTIILLNSALIASIPKVISESNLSSLVPSNLSHSFSHNSAQLTSHYS